MVAPPLKAGGVKLTNASVSPAVATPIVGAPGTVAATLNTLPLEMPPPPPGLNTVAEAVPALARSLARIVAVSDVASTNVVARSEPFQRTTAPAAKLEPLRFSVKLPPPAVAEFGLMLARV